MQHQRRRSVDHQSHRHHDRSSSRSRSQDERFTQKRKVEVVKEDLREVLHSKRSKQDQASLKIEIKGNEELDQGVQELYIGNLFNAVEESDLQHLLEEVGTIKNIQMFPGFSLFCKSSGCGRVNNLVWSNN